MVDNLYLSRTGVNPLEHPLKLRPGLEPLAPASAEVCKSRTERDSVSAMGLATTIDQFVLVLVETSCRELEAVAVIHPRLRPVYPSERAIKCQL